jgi:NADPH:quinone reductase-like Zn-dependent oxidoreductase
LDFETPATRRFEFEGIHLSLSVLRLRSNSPDLKEVIPMKAVRFHQYGDPSVLTYEDVEQPTPGPGEVSIRVAATSFNGVDANIRAGNMQGPIPVALPHTPGLDVAGTVESVGADVDGVTIGDRVIGFLPMNGTGASAEFVLAPADVLAPAPQHLPLRDAAALPLVGLTAWQALFDHGRLEAGQRLLVNGAGGAVGNYAVQLGKLHGAHVIATASPRSSERVRAAGADEVIDHTNSEVVGSVTEPVDILLNLAPIEPEQFAALATLVRPGGIVVNTTVWMPAPADESRGVRGVDLFVRSDAGQLAQLVELVDGRDLRVEVTDRVDLADLADLHARAAAGELSGKAIVVVSED